MLEAFKITLMPGVSDKPVGLFVDEAELRGVSKASGVPFSLFSNVPLSVVRDVCVGAVCGSTSGLPFAISSPPSGVSKTAAGFRLGDVVSALS